MAAAVVGSRVDFAEGRIVGRIGQEGRITENRVRRAGIGTKLASRFLQSDRRVVRSMGPMACPRKTTMILRMQFLGWARWKRGCGYWGNIDATRERSFVLMKWPSVGNRNDKEVKSFDLGITHAISWNFSDMAQRRALASLRAIRFVEVVGSPSCNQRWSPTPCCGSALTLQTGMGFSTHLALRKWKC